MVTTMRRRAPTAELVGLAALAAVVLFSADAHAQFSPVAEAGAAAPLVADAGVPAPATAAVAPSGTTVQDRSRGPSEPSLRERGGRNRRANPASGVFFVLVLVGALGYWVLKRIRR